MTQPMNPNDGGERTRLFRNPGRGMLFGVCAGLADYFGLELSLTRLVFIIGAFLFPLTILAYFVLALLLPRRASPYERDAIHGRVHAQPHESLSGVRYRFRELELRLQRLEGYVTSSRFKLDREFRNLKD